jgi:2-polyprenyl-3-methyl-5-hydroxy-6-metoxy-1,4-benzoquinol methylase
VISNAAAAWKADLLAVLACPIDHSALRTVDGALACEQGHRFAFEQGVPVFSSHPRRERVPGNMEACKYLDKDRSIDPFVDDWVVNTNGNLYWRVRGKLPRYPIPRWPFLPGDGKLLVDVGCSWGRWAMAAARAGYRPIGVDVHLDALAAAKRVSQQLGVKADFICAGAEALPFQTASVDLLFCYSVLQHLERSMVRGFFREVARLLKPGGICLVQLPNTFGLYNILRQLKRGCREATPGTFEMRYWSRGEIAKTVENAGLKNLRVRTDGFFSQNPQVCDLDLLSAGGKLVVLASEAGRKASTVLPILTRVADSLWIEARA